MLHTNYKLSISSSSFFFLLFCFLYQSVTQSLVLTLLVVFMFLRIHFMLKLIVATIINCIYYYIIFVAVKHIYDVSDNF